MILPHSFPVPVAESWYSVIDQVFLTGGFKGGPNNKLQTQLTLQCDPDVAFCGGVPPRWNPLTALNYSGNWNNWTLRRS